jgi:glutathione S-transferase
MKLYMNSRSPFARKVNIIAIEKNIVLENIICDLKNKPEGLLKANPLGLIPTLANDDGSSLYDSPVICEYLDALDGEPRFFPTDFGKRIKALKVQALSDGAVEAAIEVFMEGLKDAASQDKAVIGKYSSVLNNSIIELETLAQNLQVKDFTIAEVSVVAALGYINFRLPELGWQAKAPTLAKWYNDVSERPSIVATPPKMDIF